MDRNKIKRGLGRGLSSLIGETKTEININKLSISDLVSNKFQPRKVFDEENLQDLTNSIKERGIIQPIIVRKSSDDNSRYEIIAGERRWLAAQKAGLHEVPVVITEADDLKSLEFSIIENVQRKDLNPIEEAESYKKLIDDFSYDQEKVSKFIGKSRSHIANFLRLLSLPREVLNFIKSNVLTVGHAKILVGLENAVFVAKKIIERKLSVRQAENLVNIFKTRKFLLKTPKDINLQSLENSIREKIGLNVLIKNKKNNTGSLVLEYKDLDQLNKIIEIIKSNY
jgi:ParB family transcriptional regulator, chromosome partitioning protein